MACSVTLHNIKFYLNNRKFRRKFYKKSMKIHNLISRFHHDHVDVSEF